MVHTVYTPAARVNASRLTSMQLQTLAYVVETLTREYGSTSDPQQPATHQTRNTSDIGVSYSWNPSTRALEIQDVKDCR